MPRRLLPALLAVLLLPACQPEASRRGATVLFASGADLQSINPLLTQHPLARQVQRYVLLMTLARYDSALAPQPYLAREWSWSGDRRRLTFRLRGGIRWHDGVPTTARDVAWTLERARDPATGYPRLTDLAALENVAAADDSTVVLRFARAQERFPDVLTDLAIVPAHLLDTVPAARLRQAAWNDRPVGNGPFRFVAHEPNRRWVFAADTAFPAELGGPPKIGRLIVVIVDEPTTKLAALTSGELDFAGIQPAHASFVRRDPRLEVRSFPLFFTYGIVFNTRRPPFDDLAARRLVDETVDRDEIVEGYLYGFGTPATGPVPPGVPGYLPVHGAPVERAAEATPGATDAPARSQGKLRPESPLLRVLTRPGVAPAARSTTTMGAAAARAPTRFELLTVGSGEAALEQMVQARLARAGFQVVIRQLELSTFLARVYGPERDFDAAVLGISGDIGLGHLAPLADAAGMSAPGDPAAAQQFFADSIPVAFLYHAGGLQGANRRVRGVDMDLRGELPSVQQWSVSR